MRIPPYRAHSSAEKIESTEETERLDEADRAAEAQSAGDELARLVRAAAAGDQSAWNDVVTRFNPLVMSITRRYRLSEHDAADVGQTVWLRAVQHLGRLHEPRALPGWIVTTTKNECLRVLRRNQREEVLDPAEPYRFDHASSHTVDVDAALLAAERREAMLRVFGELPSRQRDLLLIMMEDPPPAYRDISERLKIPVGAIGPTRQRAMDKLRHSIELLSHHLDIDLKGGDHVHT
jgi:RNA polymerase sigma factor (sigma-70 family)